MKRILPVPASGILAVAISGLALGLPTSAQAYDGSPATLEVLALTNAARSQDRLCGTEQLPAVPPLKWNPALADAALGHSVDMATRNYFSHSSPEGTTPFQRIVGAGYVYRAAGENIAAGQVTPAEVVTAWLNSPGHCKNLMSPVFTEMGVGHALRAGSTFGNYWSQEFGAPMPPAAPPALTNSTIAPVPESPAPSDPADEIEFNAEEEVSANITSLQVSKITRKTAQLSWSVDSAASAFQYRLAKGGARFCKWHNTKTAKANLKKLTRGTTYRVEVRARVSGTWGQAAASSFRTRGK